MQGPGQSLRQAREAHGKTIEEMAEATGIGLPFLTALEQEAFDSLPGRGFGKLYIRAYAEVLGFDPRPVIEAYDRAVRTTDAEAPTSESVLAPRPVNAVLARWRRELIAKRAEVDPAEDEPEPELIEEPPRTAPLSADFPEEPIAVDPIQDVPALSLPVETVTPSRPARSRRWPMSLLLLLVPLPLMAYLVFLRSTPDPPPVAARRDLPGKVIAPPPSRPQPPKPVEVPRTPPRTQAPVREQVPPTSLEVAESGIGLRLVGTRLEGAGDRFLPGQRVTFVTRVLGGAAGEHIRHVWLRNGQVEQSIRLSLGGATWRTYSTKTLGRPGAWAVEARDEQGRMLARAEFNVPP